MNIYELLDKEFKISILKKPKELERTQIDNKLKSGKWYMTKRRISRKYKKEPNRNSGIEEHTNLTKNSLEGFNSRYDKQKN